MIYLARSVQLDQLRAHSGKALDLLVYAWMIVYRTARYGTHCSGYFVRPAVKMSYSVEILLKFLFLYLRPVSSVYS